MPVRAQRIASGVSNSNFDLLSRSTDGEAAVPPEQTRVFSVRGGAAASRTYVIMRIADLECDGLTSLCSRKA